MTTKSNEPNSSNLTLYITTTNEYQDIEVLLDELLEILAVAIAQGIIPEQKPGEQIPQLVVQ